MLTNCEMRYFRRTEYSPHTSRLLLCSVAAAGTGSSAPPGRWACWVNVMTRCPSYRTKPWWPQPIGGFSRKWKQTVSRTGLLADTTQNSWLGHLPQHERNLPHVVNYENRAIRHHGEVGRVIIRKDLHVSDTHLLLRAAVYHWGKMVEETH